MKESFTREDIKNILKTVFNSEYNYGINNYAKDNGFEKEQAIETATQETMAVVVDKEDFSK